MGFTEKSFARGVGRRQFVALTSLLGLGLISGRARARSAALLNVSYDVTRELYKDLNQAFVRAWSSRTGAEVTIAQSHAGSSAQVRAVIEGLEADVVTMNQALDIDLIAERAGLLARDWATRLPNQSVPFTSTILFLVRRGNPKQIKDWDDLVRAGVVPVIPNPKTSGNGRYSFLAAWAYALKRENGDEARALLFLKKLFKAVPVMDTGGRGATVTFAKRGIGDVLLTFENEVGTTLQRAGKDFAAVVPSVSILAENPVARVDKVAAKKGTSDLAQAYLQFLFSDAAQEIAVRHHFRPTSEVVASKFRGRFAQLDLVSVAQLGGWAALQQKHFADGGSFDQLIR